MSKTNKKIVITAPVVDENFSVAFTGKILPLEYNGEIHILFNTKAQIDLLYDEVLNARLGRKAIPTDLPPEEATREERVRVLALLEYKARLVKNIPGDADGDWYRAEGLIDVLEQLALNNKKEINVPS